MLIILPLFYYIKFIIYKFIYKKFENNKIYQIKYDIDNNFINIYLYFNYFYLI